MAESILATPVVAPKLGRTAPGLGAWLPLLVLAGGFAARLARAGATFLNADEALHDLLASQPTLGLAWRAALTNAHPPLLVLVLHCWRALGQSDLMLRLPSVLAGTACCWLAYRWLEQLTARATALAGLLLFSFAPSLIELSAEVRQYALLLFFIAGCLYLAERAVREDSLPRMVLFSLSLLGALLTHYSALIFALAMGVYMLLRLYPYGQRRRLFAVWLCGQAAALQVAGYFLVTHVARLRQTGMTAGIAATYLHGALYQPGDRALTFAAAHTLQVFAFLLGNADGGMVALLVFLAGMAALLLRRRERVNEQPPRPRELALLLGLPFVVTCGAGLAGLYPYGGTRHDVFLAPFALGGACLGLGIGRPARAWAGPLLAACGVAYCNFFPYPRPPAMEDQGSGVMREAVDAVHRLAPPGSIVFADYQSALLLGHYVCGHGIVRVFPPIEPLTMSDCGPYTAITTWYQQWHLDPYELSGELDGLARTYHLAPGTKVWWFSAGFLGHSAPRLRKKLLRLGWPEAWIFGRDMLLCQVTIDEAAGPSGRIE